MRRFVIYHAHGKRIGEAKTLEVAMAAGQEYGCHESSCPCCKYRIYDKLLKTNDMNIIIKNWVDDQRK